ncbi:MAG: SDR family oxidoreductase [Bacteroidetes bacterium]|nr:MAG: SDR family oxidoreductase [Bacteroidota bacterium]TAG93492.1 MAG: SDR family oxidoreductase [Bacteroidota bacterium]
MKVALITGAAQGLGRAVVEHFAEKGFFIIIHYYQNQKKAIELVEHLAQKNKKAHALQANLQNADEVQNLFTEIENRFGRLDILVNNVGNFQRKNLLELKINEWNSIIENNVNSVFQCIQLAIPLMRKNKYGRIINLGFAGISQMTIETDITAYFVAKNNVYYLTKAFAKALGGENINVHIVSPGVLESSVEKPVHEIPKKRLAIFEEMISAIDFLTSEKSDYLTGQHIEVSGGWRL